MCETPQISQVKALAGVLLRRFLGKTVKSLLAKVKE